MSLLNDLVQEMAAAGATGAHAIAGVPGSLFDGGVVDAQQKKLKKKNMMRRVMNMKEGLGVNLDRNDFDSSDVISKIDAAGKKEDQGTDTTPFGLEDEDGNIIKVYIQNDQAEEFEKTLSAMLAGADDDEDEKNQSSEIAEILFKLKDKFDIVDVEWPGIEGDVEEEQEVAGGGEDPLGGAGGEAGGEDPLGGEGGEAGGDLEGLGDEEGDGLDDEMAPDDSGAESALSQVIDMMKSDAEAKKAEADARAAEARAKEAEYSAQSSASRVKKEEQIYDMENAEKKKKDQEKEAQQMAKLARHQYDKASDAEVKLSMGESCVLDDESSRTNDKDDKDDDDELTLRELSKLIMRNLAHQ